MSSSVYRPSTVLAMKVDLLSSITWSKMTWQPQRLSSARYHLVCLGAILPMGCSQPVTTQGRDTKVGNSWETHGSSDDDFGLRATEDSSELCWPFLSTVPKLLPTNWLSFFPLSFTLGQICIVVGWVSSLFSLPLPNFHFLVFPLFPEQFNPILISAYLIVKAMVFPVVMYGCESWTVKKAECQRINAFELWCWRRLESPLDCKDIQPVHSKGDQSWVFFGRNDAKAETPALWPPHTKCWLIGKDIGEGLGAEGKGDNRGWDG